jgi:LPPG:FO 2-phospho-L-lactate transferase
MIVALAGGVGAARMLRGLVAVVDPASITAVVNTGDDTVLHGLHISPDLDTVIYTLAGAINPETGWGLSGETWGAMEELRAYSSGRLGWFNLGDHDLGTHLYRTTRLGEGATLSEVTTEIAVRWGVAVRILPMSDRRVETRVVIAEPDGSDREVGFQEYFVGRRHDVPIRAIRLAGIEAAQAAPDVEPAITRAERIVICPSNPVVSIGPVLQTAGIGAAVASRRERTVAVSPIIAGKALKGPADRMLGELGHEASVVGVARLWAPYAATLVIDEADAALAGAVAAAGMRPVVAPTVMTGPTEAAALARIVLGADTTPVGAGRNPAQAGP